jgi:hypothetical protein
MAFSTRSTKNSPPRVLRRNKGLPIREMLRIIADMDPLRQINMRRAATDLWRWSIGSQPRYGHDFKDYEPPANPATPPPTVASVVAGIRSWFRGLGVAMLRAVLIWWLSFDGKREDEERD